MWFQWPYDLVSSLSHLTFGLTPLWLPHISTMTPLCSSWWCYYLPRFSSPFPLGSLNVLPLSRITLLPYPSSPLTLSKAYLLVTPGHKGIQVYFHNTHRYATFANVTFHKDSPFFSSLSLSLTLSIASPPPGFSSLMIILDPLPLNPSPPLPLSSPLLLLLSFRFHLSPLLWI